MYSVPVPDGGKKSAVLVLLQRICWVLIALLLGIVGAELLDGTPRVSFRLGMSLAALVVLAGGWWAGRKQKKVWEKISLCLLAVLTVTTLLIFASQNQRMHVWNLFHYVLGGKYFDEVGYFDLYSAVILADAEGKQYFAGDVKTRDMYTYQMKPTEQALAEAQASDLRSRFSDKRWREFKRDLRALLKRRSKKYWRKPIADRGFNPSPAWLIVHRPLLNAIDVQDYDELYFWTRTMAVILFLATFAAFAWAFGWRPMLAAALWLPLYFGNQGRLGGYFSYDWLFCTVWAVALYRKRLVWLSAPLLAYAAMMRGFPGLLAIYPACCWLGAVVRRKKPERRHTVFLTMLAVSCLAIIALGSFTTQGPKAWMSWKEKITIHAYHHVMSANRIGLQNVFAFDFTRCKWVKNKQRRRQVIEGNEPYLRVAQACLLLAVTIGVWLRRRRESDGIVLGLAVVFVVMLLSRYYFSIGILLFVWAEREKDQWLGLLTPLWLFGLLAMYHWQDIRDLSPHNAYSFFNQGLAALFFIIAMFPVTKTLMQRRRARRAQIG